MRITSGNARGILLDSPKGNNTRPATDAARQAIFSSIGEFILNAKVLDIFAGTGSYGLEALSRGASSAVFVEMDRRAGLCLKKNAESVLKALRLNGSSVDYNIVMCDCFKIPLRIAQKFDVIFADPPYDMLRNSDTAKKILELLVTMLSTDGIAILEAPAEFEFESIKGDFNLTLIRRLGKQSKGKPSQLILRSRA